MADAFDDASGATDEARRRLLAAVAARGSAGRAEFDQTQAQLQAERENAVKQVMLDAARRGAPGQVQQLEADRVGSVYDRRIGDLGQGRADLERRLADMQLSGTQYMDEARAAVPVIRAQAVREQQLAAQKAAEAASKKSGADVSPLNAIAKQLGGIGNANKYLLDQSNVAMDAAGRDVTSKLSQAGKDAAAAGLPKSMLGVFGDKAGQGFAANEANRTRDAINDSLGLPPGYLAGLSKTAKPVAAKDPAAKKSGFSDAQVSSMRKSKQYKSIMGDAQALLSTPKVTKSQIKAALMSDYGRRNPNTLRLILAELGL